MFPQQGINKGRVPESFRCVRRGAARTDIRACERGGGRHLIRLRDIEYARLQDIEYARL